MQRTFPAIFPVTCHTDFVSPGGTFVAIQGCNESGLGYIEKALEKGAKTLVVENGVPVSRAFVQQIETSGARLVRVANARAALAELSAQAADHPAKKLKLLGITGTKGKTTTAHILFHLLSAAGYKTALLSTVGNKITPRLSFSAPLTTPQPDYLHQFFLLCVQEGVEYVVMEVAAQAMTFHRIETLSFAGQIFTNLDREHGELYPTMEEYFLTKYKLFEYAREDAPILINGDDEYGKRILSCPGQKNFLSYAMQEGADYHFKQTGTYSCQIGQDSFQYCSFPGMFNCYNIVAAVSLCKALGIAREKLIKGLAELPPLRGRLEQYCLSNGARAFIDYAHTPASFTALFQTVRAWTDDLIVLFGAGGQKDRQKRPLMGKAAAQWADKIFLTSDNPRHEDPRAIIEDICAGIDSSLLSKVTIEVDRKKAIDAAYQSSRKGSIILLLGKGPDEYQQVKDERLPFCEAELLRQFQPLAKTL